MMELFPGEVGLIPIFVAVLLGPLLSKKIERNIEAFLFLMGACAVAISRSWHIGLIEDAIQEPVIVGIVLSILVIGLIAHHHRPNFLLGINDNLSDGITLKIVFLEIVVVLGLSAAIITPILPFFMLVEAVNRMPLVRRIKANIMAFGCISIFLGAALVRVDGPTSAIAITKMQGALPSTDFLPLELQSLYIALGILVLGLISIFFAGKDAINIEMQTYKKMALPKSMAVWTARVCMFAGALLLVGVAFGVNI